MKRLIAGALLSVGVVGAHAAEPLTANRLYQLCKIEDPRCFPLLKSTYEQAMADPNWTIVHCGRSDTVHLPNCREGMKIPAFCPMGHSLRDDQLADAYNQGMRELDFELEGIAALYVMKTAMHYGMPCP